VRSRNEFDLIKENQIRKASGNVSVFIRQVQAIPSLFKLAVIVQTEVNWDLLIPLNFLIIMGHLI